jgi:hypothetical protein
VRTLVDIPDNQTPRFGRVMRAPQSTARRALIREAIGEYLARRSRSGDKDAFGLRGTDAMDGLAYQRKTRTEWQGRCSTRTS